MEKAIAKVKRYCIGDKHCNRCEFHKDCFVDELVKTVRADMQREMRACFLKYLTVDSDTRDRRRKDYNQAIFDDEKGYAVFNGTDLDMVMEKFDMALKEGE